MEQVLIGMFAGSNGYDLLLTVSLLLMTSFFIAGEIKIRFSKPEVMTISQAVVFRSRL